MQSRDNRITTIENLLPSLEEIHFQLTNTAIEDRPIESLTYSVSLEKISNCLLPVGDQRNRFEIKPISIPCSCSVQKNMSKKIILAQKKKIKPKPFTFRQRSKSIEISNWKNRGLTKRNLADLPTASTFFHISPDKGSLISKVSNSNNGSFAQKKQKRVSENKTKESTVARKQKEIMKYLPYLEKISQRKIINKQQQSISDMKDTIKNKIQKGMRSIYSNKGAKNTLRSRLISKIK